MRFVQATRALFKLVFGIFYRVEIKGYENIPDQSDGYVLCANHACWFDPLLIGTYYPKTLHFMAKKELFEMYKSEIVVEISLITFGVILSTLDSTGDLLFVSSDPDSSDKFLRISI